MPLAALLPTCYQHALRPAFVFKIRDELRRRPTLTEL